MTGLLGANGLPITSYKKEVPKALGPSFGSWHERDRSWNQLPGGAILEFDLSQLTLADYRAMRWNPQINSSLSVLTFMLHQIDWTVECEDQKIADECERQLRLTWTRLVRAMAQAFWAGYSPTVIEYENNVPERTVEISKFKDLIPEDCQVKWKKVKGSYRDPNLPNSLPPEFYVYDGIKQYGMPDIPPENCVHPDTKILCADLVWRRAGDLQVGQKIISFDEQDAHERGGKGGRAYREAEIQVNNAGLKESVEIWTDIGDSITCSTDHPFLVRVPGDKRERGAFTASEDGLCPNCGDEVVQSGMGRTRIFCTESCSRQFHRNKYKQENFNPQEHWKWVNAVDLKPGDSVAYFGCSWELEDTCEAGWLAGMFDGEGSLSKGVTSTNLSISQNSGPVLDKLKSLLTDRGFKFSITENYRDKCVQLVIQGGVRKIMEFMGEIAPVRFMARDLSFLWKGVHIKINKSVDLAVVEVVSEVGVQPIASIQTSTGTFITEGYLSHNTLWFPLLMENGDMYGRQLLKAAFAPWYFSTLIHLFSNRYYERFGEPLPVGRAPFDDVLTDPEDATKTMTGKEAMERVLMQLRNRNAVTLPSERQQVGLNANSSEYTWDISYLESQMRGADFERYMTRLDEEMSLSIFTPLLLLRNADVGSHNLGVQHTQTYLWMLNALAGDMKEYIDRYVLQRIKAYNFSEKAPFVQWKPRSLGKENTETLRAIVAGLISKDKISFDLDEMGMALGMTIKEVRATTRDEDPDADSTQEPDTRRGRDRSTSDGPRGVGEPRATGREVSARIRTQVEKAWRTKQFGTDLNLDFGFRRRFVQSLVAEGCTADTAESLTNEFYSRLSAWSKDVLSLEFSSPNDFLALFDRNLDNEIERLLK